MAGIPSIKYPPVAPEGRTLLFVTIVVALLAISGAGFAGFALVLPVVAAVSWFFRDPYRESPSLPLAVVAPCNGEVLAVDAHDDLWLGRRARSVTLRMGLLDVHTLFSPVEGKIMEQWSVPAHGDAGGRGKRLAYLITTDEGDEVVMEFARHGLPGPLNLGYQPGERVGHGRRLGFATLGCRITLYVSENARVDVAVGDRVTAAEQVLLTFNHETPVSALPDADPESTD